MKQGLKRASKEERNSICCWGCNLKGPILNAGLVKILSGSSLKERRFDYSSNSLPRSALFSDEGQATISLYRAGTFSLLLNLQKSRTTKSHLPSLATWSVCKYQSRSPCFGPISAVVLPGFRAVTALFWRPHSSFFLFVLVPSSPTHSLPTSSKLKVCTYLPYKSSLGLIPNSDTGGIYTTIQTSDCVPPSPPPPWASGSPFLFLVEISHQEAGILF